MDLVNSVPNELPTTPRLIIETAPLKASSASHGSSGSGAFSTSGSQRSSSAMHTLMEQGGLVEIGLKTDRSPSVITRTIEDTLALATTPEREAENPADSLVLPPPLTLVPPPLPSPVSPGLSDSEVPEHLAGLHLRRICAGHPRILTRRYRHHQVNQERGATNTVQPGLPVLVVDDDALTRTMMTRLLTRLGCKVSTAENGEIALEMVLSGNNGRFAVVFLDNQMPVMSGLSMVAELRKAGRKDFVVGVTGNALLSDQEEYLEAGVDRYVLYLSMFYSFRMNGLIVFSRTLIKPVLERSLRSMLTLANERLASSATGKCRTTMILCLFLQAWVLVFVNRDSRPSSSPSPQVVSHINASHLYPYFSFIFQRGPCALIHAISHAIHDRGLLVHVHPNTGRGGSFSSFVGGDTKCTLYTTTTARHLTRPQLLKRGSGRSRRMGRPD